MTTKILTVEAPDGTRFKVEGPDTASDEEFLKQGQLLYSQNQAIKADQAAKYPTAAEQGGRAGAVATPLAYQGVVGRLAQLGHAVSNTGEGAATGMESTGVPVLDIAHGALGGGVPGAPGTEAMSLGQQILNSPLANAYRAARSLFPSTENAGKAIDMVENAAKDAGKTVDVTNAKQILERAQELKKTGNTMPKVFSDFARATQETDQLPFKMSRDFASKAGQLSAVESAAVKGTPMQRQVTQFAAAMKDGDRTAAAELGMGELYDAGIKEYRQAKNLEDAKDILLKWTKRAAIAAIGGGAATAGGVAAYDAINAARGK